MHRESIECCGDDDPVRVCYQIQSHRSPEQLTRLVAAIRRMSPTSFVHVSHDRAGAPIDAAALEALGDVAVVRDPGGYGDFSHVDRYLWAVDWLRAEGVTVDWVANITGQDYPLRGLAECERELEASGVDGFMDLWRALGPESHWGGDARAISRYHFRHRRLRDLSPRAQRALRPLQAVNRLQPWFRVHVSFGLAVGRRVPDPFAPDLELFAGSCFATLSWPVVEYAVDELRRRPALVEHLRHTLAPDEMALHTVIGSSGKFTIDRDPKRYYDFSGSRFNHPRTLTLEDLPRAWASGAHFARKVDGDAHPEVLDAMDRHLGL